MGDQSGLQRATVKRKCTAMSDSTGTQQPAFEAKNLNKIFVAEKPVHALVDINLTIPEGSSTCIVGTSG